jgi:putative ABC transport system permease protein
VSRLWAYTLEAAAALWRNRTRSILTTLGMIIGTASIIAVFGISKGATSGITATFSSFGVLPIFVIPDPTQDFPQYAQIDYRDVDAVSAALGNNAGEVLPFYQRTWRVRYQNIQQFVAIGGDGWYHPDTLVMAEGRKIDRDDVDGATRVAVLTADVAKKFFGTSPAVGKDLRINGTHFTVIGVYPELQGSFFNSLFGSNSIAIPYSTIHRVNPGPADGLLIYAAPGATIPRVQELAKQALQHIHGAKAQYVTQNGQSQLEAFENVLNIIGVGLSAIGGVALVVAGIGIMNIMLVSVTERTREIGLRKSIGASRNDIALQFLMEALLLALAGGGTGMAIGLLLTIGGAELISKQLGTVIIPYVLIVSVAVGFSGAVGLLFGLYPALRAASMDPIEALRS